MNPTDRVEEVLGDIVRLTPDLAELLARLYAARDGLPGAQRYDTPRTSGVSSVKFCEHHERDACECGQATVYPAVSDPTGEVAVRLAEHTDKARRDIDTLHDAMRQLRHARDKLARLHAGWMPHLANDADRKEASGQDPGPGCRSCARVQVDMPDGSKLARWEPVHVDHLCRWCYDWRRKVGGLPPIGKLTDHHDGKRVTLSRVS